MIKEINYSGYTAIPSDYESPDGDLAASINLIPEEGSLKPMILPPSISTIPEGYSILGIHHPAQGIINYIIRQDNGNSIHFIPESLLTESSIDSILQSQDYKIGDDIKSADSLVAIGNTLIFLTKEGMRYFLFDSIDQNYKDLGNHIPEVYIDLAFGGNTSMEKNFTAKFFTSDPEQQKYLANLAGFLNTNGNGNEAIHPVAATQEGSALHKSIADSIYANLNKFVADAADSGEFVHPFFVRYAYRLFDGSHTMQSAPILIIPNSSAPIIQCKSFAVSQSDSLATITNSILANKGSIFFRLNSGVQELLKWKDIVTAIDFFVSAPVYTYDQGGEVNIVHRISAESDMIGFNFSSTIKVISEDNSENNNLEDEENTTRPPSSGSTYNDKSLYEITSAGETSLPDDILRIWNYTRKSKSDIESSIRDTAIFYKIASINIENLIESQYFKRIKPDHNLTTLLQQPRLEDDYDSHSTLIPRYAINYNARISLANLSLKPFDGFDLPALRPFTKDSTSPGRSISIYVRIKRANRTVWVRSGSAQVSSIESQFPRFLYYPDPAATEMLLVSSSGYWLIHLQPHDFLNGAYWFRGLGSDAPDFIESTSLPVDQFPELSAQFHQDPDNDALIPLLNKIYTSEVNNPFLFPALNIVSVGVSEIKAISTAAKALSQGQFGQFPLYAFTDEGVWAMEVSSTGTYSARQPITRDVCTNPKGIAQIDSAVLFPTDRGIMMISGSQTQCVTDTINTKQPFDLLQLPAMPKLHAQLGHDVDSCLPIAPFLQFISECGMLYDYVHQRVIIYNPNYTYAYVWSLKSMKWGMIYSTIKTVVNSYPEALAVGRNGALLNFSSMEGTATKGLLITRPLKLDAPDILKTINTVIQRGNFRKGNVRSVLYGSRDLINWHLVWSSSDHYLRGFSGTPWKYFRIALLCNLNPGESISGASINFTPRQTNRLR